MTYKVKFEDGQEINYHPVSVVKMMDNKVV